MEDLHNFAFSQWLKTSYLNKKHVFEGEDKRKIDYSQFSVKVEDTQQYHFEIDKITTCYNAQVGGLKRELDTIFYHKPTSFNHCHILTLDGLPKIKTWSEMKFLAIDTDKEENFYCNVNIEMIGQPHSEHGWYDNHRSNRSAIGVSRMWKSSTQDADRDIINFYACIEVPEYAVRLNNMTLDERITGSFLMEKHTSMGKSFEDSEERDIFQCWITNNRTTNEKRHEDLKDTFKEIIRRETDQ